jgi:plastocyanin
LSAVARATVAAVALLAVAGCKGRDSNATASTSPEQISTAVVSGIAPPNAIVTLLPHDAAPVPDSPAVMDQYAKQFVPHTLYVRIGQPVEFKNSEDLPHNVTAIRRGPGTEVFNVSTEPRHNYVHTFDRAGQYDISCDIHPGMQATLIAAPGDVATVADDDGRFSISNVKLGSYKLSLNFEGRTVEQPLEVKEARTEVRVRP